MSSGFGHLSRCLSLAEELIQKNGITFLIKSDLAIKVKEYIHKNMTNSEGINLEFLSTDAGYESEISRIVKQVNSAQDLLILDHYSITENYQKDLKERAVRWLQFDSHASQKFYGDLVLHASPGANSKVYKELAAHGNVEFLLGPQFAVINKKFLQIRSQVTVRKNLQEVFICFGGGDDRGATLKCLSSLTEEVLNLLQFNVFVSSSNLHVKKIEALATKIESIHLHIDNLDVQREMARSDLAIISPGTLSYEAVCLGLPMLLVTIADNQNMNASGWEKIGTAINLGDLNDFSPKSLNKKIESLLNSPDDLFTMSQNCLQHVDGKGAERVANNIMTLLCKEL